MSVEKTLEKQIREKVKSLGGLALKIASPYFTGLPDRQILMPGGKTYWVELKSKGKKPDERQEIVHDQLEKLGFEVWVISTTEGLLHFFEYLENDQL